MRNFFNIREVKYFFERISDKQKKPVLIFLLIIGIGMMTFSSFYSRQVDNKRNRSETFSVDQYEEDLERRLLTLVEKVDGVGKAKIMVTLESSIEYVFAQEKRDKTDKISDYQNQNFFKTQERNDEERKLMLVDGPGGKRRALVTTEIQPKVKGVVVVCQGGDNPLVSQQVTNVITTILNISSSRVFVTKSFN